MKNYLRRILILISSLAMVLCLISVYVRLPVKAEDGQDMYRMYNPNSGEHFYTASINERNNLLYVGWQYEGVGWVAPVSSDSPVYRLYNANGGEHHYTLDASEKDMLVRAGWNYEGIGWYSDDAKKIPLYREYNPNAFSCNHNYTTDKSEHDYLVSIGWRDEGIGWYGIDVGSSVPSIMLEQNNVEMMCTYDNSNGYYYPDSDQTMKLVLYYRTKPGVTVTSWTSSDESVAKISEFPTSNGPFNGMGNINFQLNLVQLHLPHMLLTEVLLRVFITLYHILYRQ